ncbi:MAG: Ig-like domain-containing protein [Planctomycetota bacterium]
MQTRLRKTHSLTRTLLATAGALAIAATAQAVTPGKFTQTTEADFADGDAYGTVVTNLGDIKLSSDTTELEGLPEDVTVIHDVVKVDGTTYIAAGPDAKILKLTDNGVEVVAEYSGEQVFSLTDYEGELLIGVSSATKSRVERLVSGGSEAIFEIPDTQYIWDLLPLGKDNIGPDRLILATGSKGKVLSVDEGSEEVSVLLETNQANILSLAADGQGNIFAGTDTDGLLYRIDSGGNPFVVYDAPEAEIATLVAMPDGTIYAGTAAAEQARPGRLEQPSKLEEGRPDVEPIDLETPEPQPLTQPNVPEQAVAEPEGEASAEPAGEAAEGEGDAPNNEAAGKPTPTKEQYDALRVALKDRLDAARESGQFDASADKAPAATNNATQPNRPSRAKPAAPPTNKKGNAIYRIAPDGFVAEVFRESAMILSIVPHEDKLIVATGNEGQVFSVDPALGETTVLADLDSNQITCATSTDKGLLLGAANPGALMRMELAVAEEGGYTSKVLDAGQVSIFGTFKLTADIPVKTSVAIELRTGNVGDPEKAAWSKWSKPVTVIHDQRANPLQPREIKIEVPPARYLQYRLTLKGDGVSTPIIDQADLAYVAPNTPPTVAKLIVKPANKPAPGTDPDPKLQVQWQANDANKDRLVYSLEYKPGRSDRYLTLAEDLTQPKYDWMTQHVPDGWYTLRVTAHDKLDNPPSSAKTGGRVSEPILIDNTDPDLADLKAEVLGGGKVKLTATAEDEHSPIQSVSYSIDGAELYQASLPDDLIYDSTTEPWGVTISDLSQGGHVIAVRVIDAKGNTAYRQLIVDVE